MEKLGVGRSLLIVQWCCAEGGVYDENVSQPFLTASISMWAFSQLLDVLRVTQLVPGIL